MEFSELWEEICNKSILNYKQLYQIYNQYNLCKHLDGNSAEIGVYQGYTSKMIAMLSKQTHYCYDTFEGIVSSNPTYGDNHNNGEFACCLEQVKQNINLDNVIYKKGYFPETFEESHCKFCFVYSDTATYEGTKASIETFKPHMICGGKLMFYVDDKCTGVKNAIQEYMDDADFTISTETPNFIVFTKN
jgi:O-methyltransferase